MRKVGIIIFFLCFSAAAYAQEYVETEAGKVYYETTGSGNAVLLLAGGPGGPPRSLHSIADYVARGHRAILLHQRGTGLSADVRLEATTITEDRFVDDILKVITQERLEKVFLIGHSWGAMLALDFMARYPGRVEGAVLIGAPGLSLASIVEMNAEVFRRLTPGEAARVQSGQADLALMVRPQFADPSLIPRLLSGGGINMTVNGLMMSSLSETQWDMTWKLRGCAIPVTVVNGDYDPIPRPEVEKLGSVLANCTVHFLPGCGHYVWIEKPHELQEIIENVLPQ